MKPIVIIVIVIVIGIIIFAKSGTDLPSIDVDSAFENTDSALTLITEKSENIVTDTVNSFDENLPNEIISEISKVSEDIENLLPSIPIPTIHQNIISPCDSTAPDGTRLNCLYKPDVSAEQWTMDDYEFARNAFAIGCNQYSYYGNCEGMYAKLFLAYENLSGK
jgi:hypothetical protein